MTLPSSVWLCRQWCFRHASSSSSVADSDRTVQQALRMKCSGRLIPSSDRDRVRANRLRPAHS